MLIIVVSNDYVLRELCAETLRRKKDLADADILSMSVSEALSKSSEGAVCVFAHGFLFQSLKRLSSSKLRDFNYLVSLYDDTAINIFRLANHFPAFFLFNYDANPLDLKRLVDKFRILMNSLSAVQAHKRFIESCKHVQIKSNGSKRY